jgi:hypothetical protein
MKNSNKQSSSKVRNLSNPSSIAKSPMLHSVENHREAAAHNLEAASHHMEAARQFEAGNAKKAAQSAMLANGYHAIAGQFMTDDAKHHAQTLQQSNHSL